MGCSSSENLKTNSPIQIVLEELKEKSTELTKNFIIKDNKLKTKKEKILKKREEKVANAIQTNVDKEELKNLLLKYNKKEIDNEKKIIQNQTDKMHNLYEIGIELAEKLKNRSTDELKKQMDKTPIKAPIKSQIGIIEKMSPEEVLNSDLGKPLNTALEKEGLREKFLQDFMENLKNERKTRRKEEKEKYNLEVNEFPPDDEVQFTANDLYQSIKGEYEDFVKKNFPILELIESDSDKDSDDEK